MTMKNKHTTDTALVFYVNDKRVEITDPDPSTLLVDWLRSAEVGMTGTKKVCAQGGCGACTVMLSEWDDTTKQVTYRSVNSCLHPLAACDGTKITTIEGLGNTEDGVSPAQWAIAASNGTQCGYCTPGWVMTMHSANAARGQTPWTGLEIEELFDGNLCRCTGIRPILHGFKTEFVPGYEAPGSMTCLVDRDECPGRRTAPLNFPNEFEVPARSLAFAKDDRRWYRPTSLDALLKLRTKLIHIPEGDVRLVVGNTSSGVYNRHVEDPLVCVDVSAVSDLHGFILSDDTLSVGAATTYTAMLTILDDVIAKQPAEALGALRYLAGRTAGHIVRNAASLAGNTMMVVRHAETGQPFPSDLFTGLVAFGARVVVAASGSNTPTEHDLLDFVDLWNTNEDVRRTSVLLNYRIPIYPAVIARSFKVARRHENSHAIVNATMMAELDGQTIKKVRVAFGGLSAVAIRAAEVEEWLTSRDLVSAIEGEVFKPLAADVDAAIESFADRKALLPDDGVTDDYRRKLTQSFLFEFLVQLSDHAGVYVPEEFRSAAAVRRREETSGTQHYPPAMVDLPPVGLPYIKLAAFEQACGETVYTHDLPVSVRGSYAAIVTSQFARALASYQLPDEVRRVAAADIAEHLRQRYPTFIDYVTCVDIEKAGGKVLQGAAGDDPLLLPMDYDVEGYPAGGVQWHGQPIGIVVATDPLAAENIARYVAHELIHYDVGHAILFDDALARGHFFPDKPPYPVHIWKIIRPDSRFDWAEGDEETAEIDGHRCRVVRTSSLCNGQIHFYMEAQSAYAVRDPEHRLRIWASTQSPDSVAIAVKDTLNLDQNRVQVQVPHVGGAYGGKTTRSPFVAALAALAAWKTRRPVKLALEREIDSAMIGHRHPLHSDIAIAIADGDDPDTAGRIVGVDATYRFDGGATYDCSFIVMDCMQLRSDTAYLVANYRSEGEVCQTNTTSNTAFRAFGLIQSMIAYEDAIDCAAYAIGMPPEDVRERNLYELNDLTPYGQRLEYCYLRDVWDYAKTHTKLQQRRDAIEVFNKANRWRKRGIALMPLKYGSGYNLTSLEQGGALVEAYAGDGSVLLRHGGVELGQGLATKITQIAALELGLPLKRFQTGITDTHVVGNPVSTGASTGTMLNGGAVRDACRLLRKRLEDHCLHRLAEHGPQDCAEKGIDFWNYTDGWRHQIGDRTVWDNVVTMAHQDRVNLTAQVRTSQTGGEAPDLAGKADGLVFHPNVFEEADHFEGFTYSAACSEVEVNILTGETQILRSDIIYDVGRSLNPAVDIGQVEGGFIQGVGLVMTEEIVRQEHGPSRGNLNSPNTWEYKIPATSTLPLELHVDLFPRRNAPNITENPNDLYSAKEVGEPPLVLATTVYLAIKRAILASRVEREMTDWFSLDAPATVQAVRAAAAVSPDELRWGARAAHQNPTND